MSLTENQVWVLAELRKRGMTTLSEETEKQWRKGKSYYIDARVDARGIRRRFKQGNKEATK